MAPSWIVWFGIEMDQLFWLLAASSQSSFGHHIRVQDIKAKRLLSCCVAHGEEHFQVSSRMSSFPGPPGGRQLWVCCRAWSDVRHMSEVYHDESLDLPLHGGAQAKMQQTEKYCLYGTAGLIGFLMDTHIDGSGRKAFRPSQNGGSHSIRRHGYTGLPASQQIFFRN